MKAPKINMYLRWGIRSIERLEAVSSPLIIYWHFAELVRKEIRRSAIREIPNDIAIMEIDELLI